MGVFYIIYIITTVFKQQKKHIKNCAKRTYNANYVTYRGKGSKENTEDFEVRENWVLLAWQLTENSILQRIDDERNVLL